MEYSDVKIKTKGIFGTEICINGEKLDLSGVREFALTQQAGEFPVLKLEVYVKNASVDCSSETIEIPLKSGV